MSQKNDEVIFVFSYRKTLNKADGITFSVIFSYAGKIMKLFSLLRRTNYTMKFIMPI